MTPFKTFIDIQVRFRDTDAMGHINNAVYLSYLELARMHYWSKMTGLRDYKKVDFILARAEIDYRSQGVLGEDLRVWVRVAEMKGSSFVFEYRVEALPSGRLVAEARTVQASFDYGAQKVKRLGDDFKRRVEELEGAHA